jgi:recombination protein RecT
VERAGSEPKPESLAQKVERLITSTDQARRFAAVLPRGFDQARFVNLVVAAVKSKPQLIECWRTDKGRISLLLAIVQSATLGLEPDTPLQEAWLLPRKIKGVQECQLSIGYVGIIKLARRSGEIKTIYAHEVYSNDEFDYSYGLNENITHRPAKGERGHLTHAYAVAHFTSGGHAMIVLDEIDVHRRRSSSDSWRNESARPFSPWVTNEAAMWRKSAIRALRPYLPLTAEVARAIESDERVLHFGDDGSIAPELDPSVIDAETVDEPETEPTEQGEG